MNNCQIIKDLAPLYIEKLLSEESNNLLENHLVECEDCRNYIETIRIDYEQSEASKSEHQALNTLVDKFLKYQKILKLSLCFVLVFIAVLMSHLPVPFISTFALLTVIPLICSFIYEKLGPLLLMNTIITVLVASIGAMDISEAVFFSILYAVIINGSAITSYFFRKGIKNRKLAPKWNSILSIGLPSAFLLMFVLLNFGVLGNPVTYIKSYSDISSYLKEQYEEEDLKIKGIYMSFKGMEYYAEVANGEETFRVFRYATGVINDHRYYDELNNFTDYYAEMLEIALFDRAKNSVATGQYFWVIGNAFSNEKVQLNEVEFLIRFTESNEEYPKESLMSKEHFLELCQYSVDTLSKMNMDYKNIIFLAQNEEGEELRLDLQDGILIENINKY